MKILFAAEGNILEKSVLRFGLDLAERLRSEISVVHICKEAVDRKESKNQITALMSDYPNVEIDPVVLNGLITGVGEVSPILLDMVNKNNIDLILLAKRREGQLRRERGQSIIGALIQQTGLAVMAVPLEIVPVINRIVLTTKSSRIQHCIPDALFPFLHAYGAQLSTIHVTSKGVAYKALVDDKGQNPGWLFEAMEEKGPLELMGILDELVQTGQADLVVFEMMEGRHTLTESPAFKRFYDNCPIPILFIPL